MNDTRAVFREFLPLDPAFHDVVAQGAVVFRAPDQAVCVVGQALFDGE